MLQIPLPDQTALSYSHQLIFPDSIKIMLCIKSLHIINCHEINISFQPGSPSLASAPIGSHISSLSQCLTGEIGLRKQKKHTGYMQLQEQQSFGVVTDRIYRMSLNTGFGLEKLVTLTSFTNIQG